MKLLTATNRFYFISISLFFIVGGIFLYYFISSNLVEEIDEQLQSEKEHFIKSVIFLDSLDRSAILLDDDFSLKKVKKGIYPDPVLFDSSIYDNLAKEFQPYRVMRFFAQTKEAGYIVSIKKSKIESSDLVFSIFEGLMVILGLFSIMLFISNYYFSKKLWSPFFKTITAIKTLNINKRETIMVFNSTRIKEFHELNTSLKQMIDRIRSDYHRMKDFSENAAHELQTPLTIIGTKLESLLQSKDLNAENAQLIFQALENTVRLSKLNQTLLLLTKIENRQYEEKQLIDFGLTFTKYIELYNEIMLDKELIVTVNREDPFIYKIHPSLADILVSNILSNAVKHNVQKGFLSIVIKNGGFEVSNSGEAPEFSTELLFTRFKKGHHSSEHLGLGLALVKEIVDTSNLSILYTYGNGCHQIKIAEDRK